MHVSQLGGPAAAACAQHSHASCWQSRRLHELLCMAGVAFYRPPAHALAHPHHSLPFWVQWVESRRGYDIKKPGSMDQDPIFRWAMLRLGGLG